MRTETKFVIDYFHRHEAFKEAIKALSDSEKIGYMKRNLELDENTELTQMQCNLFYAALSNVEWVIVMKELGVLK